MYYVLIGREIREVDEREWQIYMKGHARIIARTGDVITKFTGQVGRIFVTDWRNGEVHYSATYDEALATHAVTQ